MSRLILPTNPPEEAPEPPLRNCTNCRFFVLVAQSPHISGGCHARPPIPCIYGMSAPDKLGRQMPLSMSFWPSVGEMDWCREHESPDPVPETRQ